jgi:hypothetical protein
MNDQFYASAALFPGKRLRMQIGEEAELTQGRSRRSGAEGKKKSAPAGN